MKYLLDTCMLSEIVRPRPNRGALAWLETCEEDRLYLSVLSLAEIQKGIEKLAAGKRRNRLQQWLEKDLCHRFSGRIIDIDGEVAMMWARVQARLEKAGTPLPTVDGLLCATALVHNLTVITRNTTDFDPSGATTYNPWS